MHARPRGNFFLRTKLTSGKRARQRGYAKKMMEIDEHNKQLNSGNAEPLCAIKMKACTGGEKKKILPVTTSRPEGR